GAMLVALAQVIGPPFPAERFLDLLGLNAMAWIAGFIAPGSPAGLGVRESVLLAGLSAGSTETGVMLGLGYRIVTVGGDVIATLAGFFIPTTGIPSCPLRRREEVAPTSGA